MPSGRGSGAGEPATVMKAALSLGVLALALNAALHAGAPPPATLVVVNARVWTGNPAQPWAEAIAAAGERILAVGDSAAVRAAAGRGARIVDGQGGTLVSGFNDAHIHLSSFNMSTPFPPIFLQFLKGRKEVADRLTGYAERLPKGAWILGIHWSDATWGGTLPDRAWLDGLTPDHPVWLVNIDGDIGIANSAALRAAGMDGQPSVVRGGPMWQVEAALIRRSAAADDAAIVQLMDQLARAGVTSVQHNNSWCDLLILERLYRAGKLKVRVYATPSLPGWRRLRDYIATYGRGDAWLHWGALKGFGAIDGPSYYRWVSGAASAGLQVMVHVGDETGLRTLLAVFDRVRREQNLRDPRFRVEHAHDMPADVIPLMVQAGALVSWQPPLLAHYAQRTALGVPPPKNLFPCHALLAAGVHIAFGTDAQPVGLYTTPLESIQMALERAAPDGSRLTLDEALRAYTRDAAYAEFAEAEKGTLEPGKLADFVLLDHDLARVPVHALHDVQVRLTVVGGKATYQ